MKKTIALVLTVLMLLANVTALAQQPREINFEGQYKEWAESTGGEFIPFEDAGFEMWVPNYIQAAELTPEHRQMGYIAALVLAQNPGEKAAVSVACAPDSSVNNNTDLESYAAQLNKQGLPSEVLVINGNYCVMSESKQDNALIVAFLFEGTNEVTRFSFFDYNSPEYRDALGVMMASISYIGE